MQWQLSDPVEDAEVVVVDDNGDDGFRMRPANPQTLSGDHDHPIFGDSSLDTLRSRWRWWWKCRGRRPGTAQLVEVVETGDMP